MIKFYLRNVVYIVPAVIVIYINSMESPDKFYIEMAIGIFALVIMSNLEMYEGRCGGFLRSRKEIVKDGISLSTIIALGSTLATFILEWTLKASGNGIFEIFIKNLGDIMPIQKCIYLFLIYFLIALIGIRFGILIKNAEKNKKILVVIIISFVLFVGIIMAALQLFD